METRTRLSLNTSLKNVFIFEEDCEDDDSSHTLKELREKVQETSKQIKSHSDPVPRGMNKEDDQEGNVPGDDVKSRKRHLSGSSNGSNGQKKRSYHETDPEVLHRRQKQIDYGKNTLAYDNYCKLIPKDKRNAEDPMTPDKNRMYSRRGYDGLIKQWRVKLHNNDISENFEDGSESIKFTENNAFFANVTIKQEPSDDNIPEPPSPPSISRIKTEPGLDSRFESGDESKVGIKTECSNVKQEPSDSTSLNPPSPPRIADIKLEAELEHLQERLKKSKDEINLERHSNYIKEELSGHDTNPHLYGTRSRYEETATTSHTIQNSYKSIRARLGPKITSDDNDREISSNDLRRRIGGPIRYYQRVTDNEDKSSNRKTKKKYERETDPATISRRLKQIDYGKNTLGYDNYLKQVPKHKRTRNDPCTPDPYRINSRRGFDGLIKKWRIALHKYDPE